uniref:CHAT domain-containing protein n=1 Tax=Fulvivirga sp. TaxID=1931237 RepID=UPI0040494500
MKNLKFIFFFILFVSVIDGFTQNYDSYFEKIRENYNEGEYSNVLDQIESLRKRMLKDGTPDGPITAFIALKEAQAYIGLGYLDKGLEMLNGAVTLSEKFNKVTSTDHAFMIKDAADAYIQYGHFRKAEQYNNQALAIFEQTGRLTEDMKSAFEVNKAAILVGKGYYTKAIETIDKELPFFKSRVDASGKKELERNQSEYASLLVSRANALRKMGDYRAADDSFIANEKWIRENIGRKNLNYGHNLYLQGLMLEENGMNLDPLTKFYEDAYNQLRKDYSNAHYITMDVRDKLMRTYYRNDKNSKLTEVDDDSRRTLRKYHDEGSIYSIVKETLKFDKNLSDQKLTGLENELSNLIYQRNVLPKNHSTRIEMLDLAYRVSMLDNKLNNAQSYLEEIDKIQKELIGETAPEYHLNRIRLANFYLDNTDRYDLAKKIYDESWEKIVKPEITGGHPWYMDIMSHLSNFYVENDEFKKAGQYLDEVRYQSLKKWDNKDVGYAAALDKIAQLEIKLGNYDKANKYLGEAISILEKAETKENLILYTDALMSKIPLLIIYGEYDEAQNILDDIEKLRYKNEILVSSSADAQDDLAELYIKIGKYVEAQQNLNKSLAYKRTRFSNESRQIIRPLVLYAQYHLAIGEFAEAEKKAREAFNIAKKIYGVESSKTTPALGVLASMYKSIGDYARAEQILRGAIDVQTKRLGANHLTVGQFYSELALVRYYISNDRTEVEALFRKAESIVGKSIGASNPVYAEVLKNLTVVNISSGDFMEAESYLDQAAAIWDIRKGRRNNINSTMVDLLYGDIRYNQKNYKAAQSYYERASKNYLKFFRDQHPEYLKVISKLSKAYYMQNDLKTAQRLIESVLDKYVSYIEKYFPALGEREKAKFWGIIRPDYEYYNSIITSNKNVDSDQIGNLFNNALLTKSLLLNSSIKVKQRILNSGDQALINAYQDWIKSKERLTVTLAMSPDEIAASGIDITALTASINQLEKELSLKSADFSNNFDSKLVKWDEVQNAILPGEVAVEMVRFRYFDHTFTDQIKYAVLYVDGDKKTKAKMVLLENGKDLENKYLKIYRNSMRYKIEDTHSYEMFWKPLSGRIGYANTLYLSPDGVFNQINLESIPLPDSDGKYVLDAANIVLISNTKDLFLRKASSKKVQQSKIASMFGNPQFYVTTKPGRKVQEGGTERATSDVITQLPGTEIEINQLNELFGANGWRSDQFTEYDASEDKLKKINNPKVFHIATHGFFKSEENDVASQDLITSELVNNPLLRSGLLLTGAGDILNVTDYNFNINDGILTAFEAMNLNLDMTELVVLSACETGLGEIEAGEGVFGLQRAFLVAGARSVVMSLFKVSDDATQKLMIKFYTKWLATGNIRESFLQAKKEIRTEYVDPIYWAPFVMIGLN